MPIRMSFSFVKIITQFCGLSIHFFFYRRDRLCFRSWFRLVVEFLATKLKLNCHVRTFVSALWQGAHVQQRCAQNLIENTNKWGKTQRTVELMCATASVAAAAAMACTHEMLIAQSHAYFKLTIFAQNDKQLLHPVTLTLGLWPGKKTKNESNHDVVHDDD